MSTLSCVFCKIVAGSISSPRLFESQQFIVIRDIQPQAKVHLLVIPKKHVGGLTDVTQDSEGHALLSGLLSTAIRVAEQEGLSERGYRTVINTREWGGQTVDHLHLHVLGGQPLKGGFA
ncbi:MAG: histidine triad nucleotide-binding protein [Oligoflexia bacterium]|jgi:histidine triad (HIT) family protein